MRLLIALPALVLVACERSPSPAPPASERPTTARVAPPPERPPGAGDACDSGSAATCAHDGQALLRCVDGGLAVVTTCSGDAGCAARPDAGPRCDDSVASPGDPCDVPEQSACSADGKLELACRDGGYVKARVCRSPCRSDEGELRCE